MACAWGSKVNGVLTVVTIGVAVVVDLWDLLDIRRNPSMVGVCSLLRMSLSYLSLGTLLAPLCCTCIWVDRGAHHRLPFIFLGSFRHSHPFGQW
jgi:hypothetical protein